MSFKVACPVCHGTGGMCVGVTIGADEEQRRKEMQQLQEAKCKTCNGTGQVMVTIAEGGDRP